MRRIVVLCGVAALATTACGNDRTAASYCTELGNRQESLVAPITNSDQIIEMIARYRDLAASAPLDVEEQWTQLADLLETASTVDLDDPVAVQKVVSDTYASEQAARLIAEHAKSVCAVDSLQLLIPPAPTSPPVPQTEG